MCEELCAHFGRLGGKLQLIPSLPMESVDENGNMIKVTLGNVLCISKRPKAKLQALFMGHMDTTFPSELPFPKIQETSGQLIGPGVADMKAGLVIMLKVLERLEESEFKDQIGWEVLINADEEVGSPGSRSIINQKSKGKDFAFIFEPALPNGDLVSERAGSINLAAIVKGKSAHAGRDFFSGKSATAALSSFLLGAEALTDQKKGITVNLAKVYSAAALNVVPDLATAHLNIRTKELQDFENVKTTLKSISQKIEKQREVSIQLFPLTQRPPKPLDSKTKKLFEAMMEVSNGLGLSIQLKASGGVCDGNLVAAMGVPTIDTLGGVGGNLHRADEYLEVSTLEERATLAYLLLKKIVQEGL